MASPEIFLARANSQTASADATANRHADRDQARARTCGIAGDSDAADTDECGAPAETEEAREEDRELRYRDAGRPDVRQSIRMPALG